MDFSDANLLNEVKALAIKDSPNETCGLILRNEASSWRAVSLENISSLPEESFLIRPESFLSYDNIVAVYHSHPSSSAAPSHADRIHCDELQLSFLIYSIVEDKFSVLTPAKGSV